MDFKWLALLSLQKENRKMVKVNQELTPEKRTELEGILDLHHDTFTYVPKKTNVMEVNFKLTTDTPITSKAYPVPFAVREAMKKEVDDMIKLGIVERCSSPYSSPVVRIPKKDGSIRFCIDYRKLNKITYYEPEPLPDPSHLFCQLTKSQYFSKVDLTKLTTNVVVCWY